MTDVDVPAELRRDRATLDRSADRNRDRARTPMPWDSSPAGGFTGSGVTPWLPFGDLRTDTVAGQRADPGSTLWLCRKLLALRRAELAGGVAGYEQLPAPEGQWAYRVGSLVVAANFSDRPTDIPAAAGEVLLATSSDTMALDDPLLPWQGIVARLRLVGIPTNPDYTFDYGYAGIDSSSDI